MAYDSFLIAPFKSGLQTNAKPFLIPEDAFTELNNAYIANGKVKKRSGLLYTGSGATSEIDKMLRSRLRIPLTATDVNGDLAGTVPGSKFNPGSMFSCGDQIYTVPANGEPVACLSTGAGAMGFYTTGASKGNFSLTGGPALTELYFYSAEPVMGLPMLESENVNNRESFAFDTEFSYRYTGGNWVVVDTATTWTGDNKNYFYTAQYRGVTSDKTSLITTNFNYDLAAGTYDPLRVYTAGTWADFKPKFLVDAPPHTYTIATAKIVVPFADSLLFFNIVESDYDSTGAGTTTLTAYKNRCRFSKRGNALDANTSFLEPNQTGSGGGGFTDANTQEEIVAVIPLKDRLIVFFERSTYILLYTKNPLDPFIWQKISTEYGSDTTFSPVNIDNNVVTISQKGIVSSNGFNATKIDDKIPDMSFEMTKEHTKLDRVHGIRDSFEELVYWNYIPGVDSSLVYSNKFLVYNYSNNTWATFDECVTTFGYFEQTEKDIWRGDYQTWREDSSTWKSGIHDKNARRVIAGNQRGFVHYLMPDSNSNDAALYVTNLAAVGAVLTVTSQAHNLKVNDFIEISGCLGVDFVQGVYKVGICTADTFKLVLRPKANDTYFSGVYTGGGIVSRVSRISIKSKNWNPYLNNDSGINLSEIKFYITRNTDGQVTIDYFMDSSNLSMLEQERILGLNSGANILELGAYDLVPFEATQDRIWHPMYFRGSGSFIMIHITLTDDQMINYGDSGFELHAMILKTKKEISNG